MVEKQKNHNVTEVSVFLKLDTFCDKSISVKTDLRIKKSLIH